MPFKKISAAESQTNPETSRCACGPFIFPLATPDCAALSACSCLRFAFHICSFFFLLGCFYSTLSFNFSVRHAESPASQKHPAVFESCRVLGFVFFFFFLPIIPPHSRKHIHSLWAWACTRPLLLSVLCNSSLDWWPVQGVSPFLGLLHVVVEKKSKSCSSPAFSSRDLRAKKEKKEKEKTNRGSAGLILKRSLRS